MCSKHDDQSRGMGKGEKRPRTPSPTKKDSPLRNQMSANGQAQARQEKQGDFLPSVTREVAVQMTRIATTGILRLLCF